MLTTNQVEKLETDGFLVIPDVLSEADCDRLSNAMAAAWYEFDLDEQSSDVKGVRFIRNALQYSAEIETALIAPAVLDAAKAVVGERLVLNLVNYRTPEPGSAGQPLHDLARRRGRPFEKCNAIWCLDDFTAENGATRVLPGSHLDDTAAKARMGDPNEVHVDEVVVDAPRGAVVFHNSNLIHSGRANKSSRDRRSIHAAYTPPSVPTHYDWTTLPAEVTDRLSDRTLDLLALRAPFLTVD